VAYVRRHPVPQQALLQNLARAGAYVDCYEADITRAVTHAEFVEAFYTTWLFRLERWILARFCAKPSSDADAALLADARADAFAAWTVEARAPDQVLLCDFTGRTRSWLMTVPTLAGDVAGTQLLFGSAVVPARGTDGDRAGLGLIFAALLGFHKLYSRALLAAARARLQRRRSR
jgi:hypothetical protein